MSIPRRNVLIADDDKLIVRMLSDMFESEFELTTVNDGNAAVAALGDGVFSAVLCDQMMPGIIGVEVLQRCQRLQPHAARILMTASDRVEDVRDAVNIARVHRFISKPLRSLEVGGIVKGAIHEVELESENERLVEELQLIIGQVRAREQELERELNVRTRELKDVMEHLMRKQPE